MAELDTTNGIIERIISDGVTVLVKSIRPVSRDDAPGSSGQLLLMLVAALLCILVFAFLALELRVGGLTAFDSTVTAWVRAFMNLRLTHWMLAITDLGSLPLVTALTVFTVLYLFAHRDWGDGLGITVASLGSWWLEIQLKLMFLRPRPDIPHLAPATGYSFPSGHATVTSALFFTLALVYCRHAASRTGRALVLIGAALLVLLVGISRVYLGVHYPSDVVAGWAVGGLLTLAIAALLRRGLGALNRARPV